METKMETKKIYSLPPIVVDDVRSVYVGTPHKCMCGCSGKYTYAKANQELSSKDRGYAVNDNECNDKKVERVLDKVRANQAAGIEVSQATGGPIYDIVIEQTEYVIRQYTPEGRKLIESEFQERKKKRETRAVAENLAEQAKVLKKEAMVEQLKHSARQNVEHKQALARLQKSKQERRKKNSHYVGTL